MSISVTLPFGVGRSPNDEPQPTEQRTGPADAARALVRLLQQERRDRRTDSDAHEMVTVPCDHRIS